MDCGEKGEMKKQVTGGTRSRTSVGLETEKGVRIRTRAATLFVVTIALFATSCTTSINRSVLPSAMAPIAAVMA